MIKKASFLLVFLLAIAIIMLTLLINFKLTFRSDNIIDKLDKSNYSQISYQKIENSFDSYLSQELKERLISQEEVKKDIEEYVLIFFANDRFLHEKEIKEQKKLEIEAKISLYLTENELVEEPNAITNLSGILADKYVNIIFPVYELELIEIYYHQFTKLIFNLLVFASLLLIVIVNSLLIIKKRKHIQKALIFSLVFLSIINLLLYKYQLFLFNQQITDFINKMVNYFVKNNCYIIILMILLICFKYYFDKKQKLIFF